MSVPAQPKIYHIVHIDRLASIINDGYLWCDAEISKRVSQGTTIGMNTIKQRRLKELTLDSHPDLYVGECVPFYFCPRSVMLYLISKGNHRELTYRGGQTPIIHLQADLRSTVAWAEQNQYRWAFTLSNAGSRYFKDRKDLSQLNEINWDAIHATYWHSCREEKQAEFLIEHCFPWHLIEYIGVHTETVYQRAVNSFALVTHRPQVAIRRDWYY